MMRAISRAFSHPRTGAIASLAAVALAGALAGTMVKADRQERFLKARIAALAAHDASALQSELISCRATVRSYAAQAAAPQRAIGAGATVARDAGARRRLAAELVDTPPAGVDVCARMESADQAVMRALDRP